MAVPRLLRALAWIAPVAAVRRARALETLRYIGADGGRRGSSFANAGGSANVAIGAQLTTLRNRSREMVRDHWAFQRILDVTVAHAVGYGIGIRPNTGSDRIDAQVTSAFEEWSGASDVTGESELAGLVALAVRSMLEGGDVALRMLDLGSKDSRAVPLGLQLWEGDIIDHGRNGVYDSQKARLGVGLGPLGQRTGYWLFPEHPGEWMPLQASNALSAFVPRDGVVHLFKQLRPGQIRGVPVFAPVLMPARDLADLMDAIIVGQKMAATFAGFITSEGDPGPLSSITSPGEDSATPVTSLEPGMMARLKPGEDIKFGNGQSAGNSFEAVMNSTLYAMAAGAGITYTQLTGNLSQANFSSLRAGRLEFRTLIQQLQWLVIVPKLLQRIVDRWTDRAIIAGKLRERGAGETYKWKFIMPAWEAVDPKELQSDVDAVRAGRLSGPEFIASWGRDWKAVVKEQAEFLKVIDGLGLVLDIDPRKVAKTGQAQAEPGAAAGDASAGGN